MCPQHDRRYSAAARHRTTARAESKNNLERVPQAALELIVAADVFTTEVWTSKGLTRFFVLFFINLSTRKVAVAGIASRANGL
jgi:hypothetical protein